MVGEVLGGIPALVLMVVQVVEDLTVELVMLIIIQVQVFPQTHSLDLVEVVEELVVVMVELVLL